MKNTNQPKRRMIVASTLAVATLVSCAAATMPAMAAQPDPDTTISTLADTPDTAGILAALKDVKVTADGKPVDGFDPMKDLDIATLLASKKAEVHYTVPAGSQIEVSGIPDEYQQNVTTAPQADGKGVDVTASLGGYTIVYHFDYEGSDANTGDVDGDGKYTVGDLKNVTATVVKDGKDVGLVSGWDASKTDYQIPTGASVRLDHLPDGWKATPAQADGKSTIEVADPDGKTVSTFTFTGSDSATTDPITPDNNGGDNNGTDNGGKDDGTDQTQQSTYSFDLTQAKRGTGIVGLAKGGQLPTPVDDKGGTPHTTDDVFVGVLAGVYDVTLESTEADSKGAPSVHGTWYEKTTVSDDGVFGSAVGSKRTDFAVKAKWFTPSADSENKDMKDTVRVTMSAGSWLDIPSLGEGRDGTLHFTRVADLSGSDQTQDGQNQTTQNPTADKTADTQNPAGTLPQTGVATARTGVMGLIGMLMAGLALIGVKRRA